MDREGKRMGGGEKEMFFCIFKLKYGLSSIISDFCLSIHAKRDPIAKIP